MNTRWKVLALSLLLPLFCPNHLAIADESDDELRLLRPIVDDIEGKRFDAARKPLQQACGGKISRRCQYVWARYYELQSEYFAALASYNQFLLLSKTEINPDEKLLRQIEHARRKRLELSQRLQPAPAPDSVEGMLDSILSPPPLAGSLGPATLPQKPAETTAPPPTSAVPAAAAPGMGGIKAALEIETDISGVIAQGLEGFPDGLTLEKGSTVLKQPEGTRFVSFHLPGGYQVAYQGLKLKSGEKYPLEVLWRPQLQAQFPELRNDRRWNSFIEQRRSPASYGHKVAPGDLIAMGMSSALLVVGSIVSGVMFSKGPMAPDGILQGIFLGAVPLFAGTIGVSVSLHSIFTSIPDRTMPTPGKDVFGRMAPASHEIMHTPSILH